MCDDVDALRGDISSSSSTTTTTPASATVATVVDSVVGCSVDGGERQGSAQEKGSSDNTIIILFGIACVDRVRVECGYYSSSC